MTTTWTKVSTDTLPTFSSNFATCFLTIGGTYSNTPKVTQENWTSFHNLLASVKITSICIIYKYYIYIFYKNLMLPEEIIHLYDQYIISYTHIPDVSWIFFAKLLRPASTQLDLVIGSNSMELIIWQKWRKEIKFRKMHIGLPWLAGTMHLIQNQRLSDFHKRPVTNFLAAKKTI